MTYTYEYELGDDLGEMVNLEDPEALGIPPFPVVYRPGAVSYRAGDGNTYPDGYPQADWTFIALLPAAWEWLMGFFGTARSVTTYVTTKTDDDEFATFQAIMHRPMLGESAERGVGAYLNVQVKFTHMTAAE